MKQSKPSVSVEVVLPNDAQAVIMVNRMATYLAGVTRRAEQNGGKSMEGLVFRAGKSESLTEEDYM